MKSYNKKVYILVENEISNYFLDEIKFLEKNNVNFLVICFSEIKNFLINQNNIINIDYRDYNSLNIIIKNFYIITKILIIELFSRSFSFQYIFDFKKTVSNICRSLFLANKTINLLSNKNSIFISYRFNQCATVLSILKMNNKIEKFYSRAHGVDLYENRYNKRIILRGFQMKYIDELFCVSKNGSNYVKSIFFNYKHKISYSYLGTNMYVDKINISNEKSNVIKLISIGYLNPVKKIDKLFSDLDNSDIHIDWVHIGNGPQYSKLSVKEVKNRNLKVKFLGNLDSNEIFNLLRLNYFDFSVCYSFDEGLPISLTEVTKFGIPIISYNVGGVSEIVLPDSGVLMDKHQNIVDVLININKNSFRNRELRLKIKYNSENIFNLDKNLDLFYGNLLKKKE